MARNDTEGLIDERVDDVARTAQLRVKRPRHDRSVASLTPLATAQVSLNGDRRPHRRLGCVQFRIRHRRREEVVDPVRRGAGMVRGVSGAARLHFIGCGDAFGNGGRFQTCFWLEGAGESLLIDCGATSLTALKAAGVEPNDIGCVVLTHLHGDHFGGLPFLVLDGQFRRRERPLTIAGPPGTRERVHAAMDLLFPGSAAARRRFDIGFIELDARQATPVGPAVISSIAVEQPDTPACALRVEYAGRVIAYTGDTAWTDELIELADGADLFVAEAYFFERQVPFHLDYATVLAQRDRLNCGHVVLTHMSPDMLGRQADAAIECAHDGMVVTL